jgi:uncharacterized protein (TIGR02266 family)
MSQRPPHEGRPPGEDRRESRRVPIRLLVRDRSLGGSFEEREGNLGLGGVYFREAHPPQGSRVELRFVLPGTRAEIAATGEVIYVDREEGGFGAHVRFSGLALEQELAIARFLDQA